jgi:hypothetical protein
MERRAADGQRQPLWRKVMKAGAFRSAATWLAAMFVGTMFVAASTSFAHVL